MKNQKGFVNIIVIIGVVILVGIGGYFVWSEYGPQPCAKSLLPAEAVNKKTGEKKIFEYPCAVPRGWVITNYHPASTPSPTPTPNPKPSPTPAPISNDTNWDSGKEYFYYYFDKKIPLKFLGMKDGYPHFVTQDSTKAEVLLTDEFVVKIKSGATREDLEALNRKYNISIVKNIYGTSDEFVLTVKNDPTHNALDMANLYHSQTIIEWTDPNFIQLSVRPL